jgi:dynein heavy chain
MDEGAKNFVKEVKALPKKVRDEDVFRGVDAMVKNFLVSVPLVADLRSPAMRDRHWQQLMSTTKVRLMLEVGVSTTAPWAGTAQASWGCW